MNCSTCDNYRLVPNGDGMLVSCPDCREELPRCPVHGQAVLARNGRIVGRCWECCREAADGKLWLREHPYRVPVAA